MGSQLGPHAAPQRGLSGEVEIRQALERLNTLGSVMMIGAHPDDEREVVLAYLALGRHLRTAYLSMTRGEGGQNLLGPEQGDASRHHPHPGNVAGLLGRVDGAEQYFHPRRRFRISSKTAEETLKKWDSEKALADVVWNIRRFQPRRSFLLVFTGTPRDGHGHHQASAILGKEAFTAAADPTKFPDQLAYVQPWQAKRLLSNQNLGGRGGGPPVPGQTPAQPPAQLPGTAACTAPASSRRPYSRKVPPPQPPPLESVIGRLGIDVGEYSPELGASFGEIGGFSRSTNRSQGQGSAERKGSQFNYFVPVGGDQANKDLFDRIDTSWARLPGGAPIGAILKQALDAFSPAHPEALLEALAKARPLIAAIKDPLAQQKLKDLDEAMLLCAGVWLEPQAENFSVTPGSNLKITFSALARTPIQVVLTGIQVTGMEGAPTVKLDPVVLKNNQPSQYTATFRVPEAQPYSQPYWLEEPKEAGMYVVRDQRNIGLPESAPILETHFRLRIAGAEIEIVRPVQHRYVDHTGGEMVRPLTIVPPVAVGLSQQPLVYADVTPRKVNVPVRSTVGKVAGDLRLEVPSGWRAQPVSRHFELAATDEQTTLAFELTPPTAGSQGKVRAVAQVGVHQVSSGIQTIEYPHIVTQTLFPAAEAPVVRVELRSLAKKVGYIMGSGDEVATALEQMGCEVTMLSADDLTRGDLSKYDAIVTGVRAFNVPQETLRANYQCASSTICRVEEHWSSSTTTRKTPPTAFCSTPRTWAPIRSATAPCA